MRTYQTASLATVVAVLLAASVLLSGFMAQPAFAAKKNDKSITAMTTGQHVPNSKLLAIKSLDFSIKKKTTASTIGTLTVSLVQDGKTLSSVDISIDSHNLKKKNRYVPMIANLEMPFK